MNDGKPNWWSRPSTPPEAARIPTPPPAEADDFPLQAPGPAEPATPEPAAEPPATPKADMTKEPAAPEPAAPPAAPEALAAPAAPDEVAAAPAEPVATAEGAVAEPVRDEAGAPQPLHEPDEYRTPPYGEPGPWAPAPPVQLPAAPLPGPQAAVPAPQAAWGQYDPWGVGQAPVPPPARKKSRRGLALVGALAFALVTGVIGGGVGAYIERNGSIAVGTVELPQAGAGTTDRAPDSVAGIAAAALPGVVTLHVSGGGSAGTGTGFVLDNRGHILTNNHVVDAAATSGDITVTFSSGETASAKLIGKDTGYDLAVVRVTGVTGLKPLPLGNSDDVRVGDPVVAIGAPFDLSNTVTSGIISAKERPITAGGEKGDGSDISYVDALQTDAPINPGNSGGPLLDGKGRVIGINSAIRAAGGSGDGGGGSGGQAGSIGLGFAIPVNQGKRVAEELINTGKATHPVIGVSLDMQFNGDGARVGDKGKDGTPAVTPDGPAAKAGLRPGDVITKVDGQRVHNGEELIVKIRAHRPGDALALTLTRDGRELTRTVTLGSAQGT
ncbi:PDZ domain-containing protein [Streptomyces sp. R302]|uniref:trypsin-like peptidase domain-containing protein n=1 Tax=unclassified Streptomyces TaxID=2593676 RepID=UPI00145D4FA7|nr:MULTISPECIES: trypsin-like peptidase domain-containing protein [unclassified Streptomyces]NML52823.1 PDZ domain-containing protein [Streptomyces sp. R301]NML78658.1 PDZ domain-containing protein [Streptomyces sp. R302]